MDDWAAELRSGAPDAAWDRFIDRYRRLIFAAIRHYVQEHDDVMDVFARVCEALRENDLRRLRTYLDASQHPARFSTWPVVVVRHLTVDWFRCRDGRRRLSIRAERLSPLGRRIFEHVFIEHRSHIEAFELICTREAIRLELVDDVLSGPMPAPRPAHPVLPRDELQVPLGGLARQLCRNRRDRTPWQQRHILGCHKRGTEKRYPEKGR